MAVALVWKRSSFGFCGDVIHWWTETNGIITPPATHTPVYSGTRTRRRKRRRRKNLRFLSRGRRSSQSLCCALHMFANRLTHLPFFLPYLFIYYFFLACLLFLCKELPHEPISFIVIFVFVVVNCCPSVFSFIHSFCCTSFWPG